MKTIHIPALAIALCSSVPALAQTTASTVTAYGIVDACVARADLGASTLHALGGGCSYGSRLGFRGSEDLGGGQRAYFTLESGFGLDTGVLGQGGRFFGRKALVGLSGAWGAVEAGRDYAPAFYIVQPVDPMGLGIGTASSTIWTGAPATGAARVDNAINYLSPNWSGVSLRLHFAPGEQGAPAPSRSRDVLGLNLLYRSGDTLIGASHVRNSNATDSADDTATTVTARQSFGSFSLAAMVQVGAWEGTRTAAAPSSASSIFSRDYRSYLLGGSVKAGAAGMVNLSLKRYDDRTSGNFDATQFSASYVHTLSKRTELYAAWSQLKNKRASSYSVSDASGAYTGVTAGASTSLLALGIKHVF
jgi:general bacterial porin, GBP family